jgi:hypothetical protein
VPLTVVDLSATPLLTPDAYGAPLILVRPDQHIAWRGTSEADAGHAIDVVRCAVTSPERGRRRAIPLPD